MYRANRIRIDPARATRPLSRLLELLAGALDALPAREAEIRGFGETWGLAWGSERRRETPARPRSRAARAEILAHEIRSWGFEPKIEPGPQGKLVVTGRCLFEGLLGRDGGRCCTLEEGLLSGVARGLLGPPVSVRTEEGCRHEVRV